MISPEVETEDLGVAPSDDAAALASFGASPAVSSLRAPAANAEDVLRELASYVGAGGYNAETVDPAVFSDKIVWGINHLINGTIQRCADVIEEQSKNYARATWGSAKRAILDLRSADDSEPVSHKDWRIGQMHVELEYRAVSMKGGELYCDLCKQLVGEDGTLHPASCPLSHGYDHLRFAKALSHD